MSGPDTYVLCERARDAGAFVVCDSDGRNTAEVATDILARELATARWPGCQFAITTLAACFATGAGADVDLPLDQVVMAVLGPGLGMLRVLGFIVGDTCGPGCVPFTPAVWPDAIDKLPPRASAERAAEGS